MVVVSGTVLVLCPALVNRLPFFYFDSTTYIEQIAKALKVILPSSGAAQAASLAPVEPVVRTTVDFGAPEADRIVFSGRSVYYGLLAWIGWASSIWLPVVIQAATLSWLVVTLFYRPAPPNTQRPLQVRLPKIPRRLGATFTRVPGCFYPERYSNPFQRLPGSAP